MLKGQPGIRVRNRSSSVFLMYHHAVQSAEWHRGTHARSTILEVTEPEVLQSHLFILFLYY